MKETYEEKKNDAAKPNHQKSECLGFEPEILSKLF